MKNTNFGAATILIVEDCADILELLELTLSKQGHTVLSARCPEQAMAIWEEYGGQIDLLVTDLRLGASGSGLDLAERLLALKPSLKVLAMSGFFSGKQLSVLRGHVELLQKPFSLRDIVARIEPLLRSSFQPVGC